jgi:hypothetical protein
MHRRAEYLKKGEKPVAKYMCRFDGPYTVTATHPECLTYTLSLPNQPNVFPVIYSSELELYIENDNDLFPSRKLAEPGPIVNDTTTATRSGTSTKSLTNEPADAECNTSSPSQGMAQSTTTGSLGAKSLKLKRSTGGSHGRTMDQHRRACPVHPSLLCLPR